MLSDTGGVVLDLDDLSLGTLRCNVSPGVQLSPAPYKPRLLLDFGPSKSERKNSESGLHR